ncbi:MAG TPA: hypothetical protein PKL83_01140, partial [bacterium]|nr:hypothetical protein [bacterium]
MPKKSLALLLVLCLGVLGFVVWSYVTTHQATPDEEKQDRADKAIEQPVSSPLSAPLSTPLPDTEPEPAPGETTTVYFQHPQAVYALRYPAAWRVQPVPAVTAELAYNTYDFFSPDYLAKDEADRPAQGARMRITVVRTADREQADQSQSNITGTQIDG